MNNYYYYIATILYQVIVVFSACAIPNVDILFNLVSVICVNCISFFFPATFYIMASKRNRQNKEKLLTNNNDEEDLRNKTLEACAFTTFILGLIAFVLGSIDNYQEIAKIIEMFSN